MSLSKKNRVKKSFFKKPPQKEGFFTSKNLSLKVFPNKEDPKISVVVSSSSLPKAVDRNKTKRVIKEVFKKETKESNSLKNKTLVFYFKKQKEKVTKKELKKETEDLIKKAQS